MIKVYYRLTQAGQKADMLAGGAGRQKQCQEIEHGQPLFARALALATVDADGQAVVGVHSATEPVGYEVVKVSKFAPISYGFSTFVYSWYEVKTLSAGPARFDLPLNLSAMLADERRRREQLAAGLKAVTLKVAQLNADPQRVADKQVARAAAAAHDVDEGKVQAACAREQVARDLAKEEKATRFGAEMIDWVEKFGSARLKKAVTTGLIGVSTAVYRDERLAVERRGWIYDRQWLDNEVEYDDIRNPSELAMSLLIAAKVDDPAVRLRWASHDDDGDHNYCEREQVKIREAVLVSDFLGRRIVYRFDDDKFEGGQG